MENISLSILLFVILLLVIYLSLQRIRCSNAQRKSKERLSSLNAKTLSCSYGKMTYIDEGKGEVILSIHGIFGGFDQAYETCKVFGEKYRILAPSRFGYLYSDIKGKGTPKEQAEAYLELINRKGIDKVFLLATSAGGTVAFRFALDYPERTKGLILFSSSLPYSEKPEKYPEYAGPPQFLCYDYAMFLICPLFQSIMGMDKSTIYGMLPIRERKKGVAIDAAITNIDMARNYDEYRIEDLKVPILILHSKDDKLASFESAKSVLHRFPRYQLVSFDKGGHLMVGHEKEVKEAVISFIEREK